MRFTPIADEKNLKSICEWKEILVCFEKIQEIVDLNREDASLLPNKTYSEVLENMAENNKQIKSLGKDILEEKANTYRRISNHCLHQLILALPEVLKRNIPKSLVSEATQSLLKTMQLC